MFKRLLMVAADVFHAHSCRRFVTPELPPAVATGRRILFIGAVLYTNTSTCDLVSIEPNCPWSMLKQDRMSSLCL